MRIDILTLFPEMCEVVLNESIVGRARKNQLVELYCHNIRDYAFNKHRRVDDAPYGGGKGMVMQAEPIFQCYQAVCNQSNLSQKPYVIYLSPQGNVLTQQKSIAYSQMDHIILLCGHYEGVDERVIEAIVDEEVSIGDYVLTGGELPALVLTDSIVRLCDGVLSDAECFEQESHYHGLLEYPQYTRPEVWQERTVPEILLSGHHANIEKWKLQQSLDRTKQKRIDLFEEYIAKNGEK